MSRPAGTHFAVYVITLGILSLGFQLLASWLLNGKMGSPGDVNGARTSGKAPAFRD